MNDDLYKSPESDVSVTSQELVPLPNALVVALLILGVSFVLGAIIAAIEFFLGFTLPGNTFLTTIIPAFAIGNYYGSKRKAYFPRGFRIKVIAIWLALGVVIAAVAFYLIAPAMLNPATWNAIFVGIFVGMVLLGSLFCYFALSFGEKIGITAALKKNQR